MFRQAAGGGVGGGGDAAGTPVAVLSGIDATVSAGNLVYTVLPGEVFLWRKALLRVTANSEDGNDREDEWTTLTPSGTPIAQYAPSKVAVGQVESNLLPSIELAAGTQIIYTPAVAATHTTNTLEAIVEGIRKNA